MKLSAEANCGSGRQVQMGVRGVGWEWAEGEKERKWGMGGGGMSDGC